MRIVRAEAISGERPNAKGRTPAQKSGLRYEKRVAEKLERTFGARFQREPCYRYETRSGGGRCYPDGVICFGDRLLIVEIKLSHCLGAWKQLRGLYQPVVALAHGLPTEVAEISRSYDPDVALPEPHALLLDPGELERPSAMFRVLRWKI
jgi:hypothetical protein